jgi:hypothetical protein
MQKVNKNGRKEETDAVPAADLDRSTEDGKDAEGKIQL